jgi:phosphatidylglycerol---prolipoprotein diacylglyceryl transferase
MTNWVLLSLIPYYTAPSFHLGPLKLEPFGLFVALGVLLASYIVSRQSVKEGLDPQPLMDFAFWGILGGVIMAHFVHLFLYHPEELRDGPLRVLKIWDGLSSSGGWLGSVIAAVIFFRLRRVRFAPYADAVALGLAPGWAVARLGCFAVHDHPGIRSTFPLAVNFPPGAVDYLGGPRHDLGLYDALLLFGIAALLFAFRYRGLLKGRLLALLALLYAVGRFALDFLRASDVPYHDARYFNLTPAQYGCFGLLAYGAYQLLKPRRGASSRPAKGP